MVILKHMHYRNINDACNIRTANYISRTQFSKSLCNTDVCILRCIVSCKSNKWPGKRTGEVGKCQLFSNETYPGVKWGSYRICTSKDCGKTTLMQIGDCHPEYVYCEATKSCEPILYSSCYDDWLNAFNLELCIIKNPRRLTRQCLKQSGWIA